MVHYYSSDVQLEIGNGGTSSGSFTVQDCFSYPRFFVVVVFCLFVCLFVFAFPYGVENCPFMIYKELCWNFGGYLTESVDFIQ